MFSMWRNNLREKFIKRHQEMRTSFPHFCQCLTRLGGLEEGWNQSCLLGIISLEYLSKPCQQQDGTHQLTFKSLKMRKFPLWMSFNMFKQFLFPTFFFSLHSILLFLHLQWCNIIHHQKKNLPNMFQLFSADSCLSNTVIINGINGEFKYLNSDYLNVIVT